MSFNLYSLKKYYAYAKRRNINHFWAEHCIILLQTTFQASRKQTFTDVWCFSKNLTDLHFWYGITSLHMKNVHLRGYLCRKKIMIFLRLCALPNALLLTSHYYDPLLPFWRLITTIIEVSLLFICIALAKSIFSGHVIICSNIPSFVIFQYFVQKNLFYNLNMSMDISELYMHA
jgi:hypothetical protein